MRERDAKRETLDGVVVDVSEALATLDAASKAVERLRGTAGIRSSDENPYVIAVERIRELRDDARFRVLAAGFRLSIRFSDDDPVVGTFAEWRETFERLPLDLDALLDLQVSNAPDAGAWQAFNESRTELAQRLSRFLVTARDWVNSI